MEHQAFVVANKDGKIDMATIRQDQRACELFTTAYYGDKLWNELQEKLGCKIVPCVITLTEETEKPATDSVKGINKL